MREGYQRALSRLRRHAEALDCPVRTELRGCEITLWRGWDDDAGVLRCLAVRFRYGAGSVRADTARSIALAALGPDWLAAREVWEGGERTIYYALPSETPRPRLGFWAPRKPDGARYFNPRNLLVGIGQQDNGAWRERKQTVAE